MKTTLTVTIDNKRLDKAKGTFDGIAISNTGELAFSNIAEITLEFWFAAKYGSKGGKPLSYKPMISIVDKKYKEA